MYTYQFDIHKKELIASCSLYPTEISQSDSPWLYARNNKYTEESINYEKVGKWMLFLSRDSINMVWDQIKMAVASGDLWHAKVSTTNFSKPSYAVMIYTKDYTDLNDVINVLNYLESSGIKSPHATIKYKTDQQTRAGIYSGGRQKPWIYSSDTIHSATVTVDQRSHSPFWRYSQSSQSSSSADAPPRSNYPR